MISNISVVIITKNAEETLGKCLESVCSFSEVVIFDNGSTDKTKALAQSFENVKWFEGKFMGFGPTKNHAVSLASNDWILSIDADESLTPELADSISKFPLSNAEQVGQLLRHNYFLGKEMKVAGWGRDKLIRLFNRQSFQFSDRAVHEKVEIIDSTPVTPLNGALVHDAVIRLEQTLNKANFYSELFAQNSNKKALPIFVIILKAKFAFFRSYILQAGFLAGWRGFALSSANAIGVFYKYMKIYALRKQEKFK